MVMGAKKWPHHFGPSGNVASKGHRIAKSTKWRAHPAQTRISLGNCPVWSVFIVRLSAIYWLHSEDWSDWADTHADIWLFPVYSVILLVLSCAGLYGKYREKSVG